MTRKLATIVALKFLSTKKTIYVIKFSFRITCSNLKNASPQNIKIRTIIKPWLEKCDFHHISISITFFFDYFRAVIKQAIYKILKIFLKKQTNYVSDMIK